MKKIAAVTLLLTLALPMSSYAFFFPMIVFDPTVNGAIDALNAATTANQIQQILNQIEQIKTAVDTYLQLKETYDLAKRMSQYLTGLNIYALELGRWQGPGGGKDLFGSTSGIQQAMGGQLTPALPRSYSESTNPLNSYTPEFIAAMNSLTKDRVKANASTVAIADSAAQQSLATVGSVAGAVAGSESRVEALTQAALSDDPEMNTHAALLNRINVAAAYSLASQQDANKLLSVIANAHAVALKSERERYAQAINMDVYLKNNFKKDWTWASAGATDAYQSIKISDYVRF